MQYVITVSSECIVVRPPVPPSSSYPHSLCLLDEEEEEEGEGNEGESV